MIDGIGEEGGGGEGALSQTLTQIFNGQGGIFAFCQTFPAVRFFLAPPNVRNKPAWFPRFRPTMLRMLQEVMTQRPQNIQVLEDHQGDLDPDGIHFSIMGGVLFVQNLHDQAVQLSLVQPPDPVLR